MKTARAYKAIGFKCPYCGKHNFSTDTLEPDTVDGFYCNSDVIDCDKCGKEVNVIEDL